jgi:hypothetical protein
MDKPPAGFGCGGCDEARGPNVALDKRGVRNSRYHAGEMDDRVDTAESVREPSLLEGSRDANRGVTVSDERRNDMAPDETARSGDCDAQVHASAFW